MQPHKNTPAPISVTIHYNQLVNCFSLTKREENSHMNESAELGRKIKATYLHVTYIGHSNHTSIVRPGSAHNQELVRSSLISLIAGAIICRIFKSVYFGHIRGVDGASL